MLLKRRSKKVGSPTRTEYYVTLSLRLRVEMNDSPTFETGDGLVCPTDEARMAAFSSTNWAGIPGFVSVHWIESEPIAGTTVKRR